MREVYRWFWTQRYTAEQAYETFQRLRRNPRTELARAAGFPADLPPHQANKERHSLDTVKAAWAVWNREAAQAGTLPALWDFLADPVPHQPHVLAAIASRSPGDGPALHRCPRSPSAHGCHPGTATGQMGAVAG